MKLPIYLDYAASTPVAPEVFAAMQNYMTIEGLFANPSSITHEYGRQSTAAIQKAREQVAALINADPEEIVFTSGATESDNLALFGAARFYQTNGKHIITMSTEHKAVLDPCKQLAREGFDLTVLDAGPDGLLDLDELRKTIRDDTILVSVMHVNNETGVIQDIPAIAELVKSKGVIFHVDAAQSVARMPVDVQAMSADLMSISGHKIYAPKGVGVLYVRKQPRVRIKPLFYGGGQEQGLRPGTPATQQIVAMGAACELAQTSLATDFEKLTSLRQQFLQGLEPLSDVYVNGHPDHLYPGTMSISFAGVNNDALIMALSDLAVTSGSACSTASLEISHVLKGMGMDEARARSTIRFSMGRYTTVEEVAYATAKICEQVTKLRELSPLC